MAAPAAPLAPGTRVALHGLSTAVLNGALGVVEAACGATAARGRVAVRVTCPSAAVAAHAVAAVKAENLRPCTSEELAQLYAKALSPHLQAELRAASLALQHNNSRGDAGDEPPALQRLRSVATQCAQALTYLDDPANALPASTDAAARDGIIALYAFLLATACGNVATVCELRGDAQGALAAYAQAFERALQRRLMPVAAARYGQQGLVQEQCLRYGEALRVAGRASEASRPLHLAARVAAAEEDEATEAAAQGTLCSVLLSLSEHAAADAAGSREVALLEAAAPPAPPLALARARAGLANAKHARAAAAGAGTPECDAFLLQAEALADAAAAALPPPGRAATSAADVAEAAEIGCAVHTVRGHVARLRGNLQAAARHYAAGLDAVTGGSGDAGCSSARPPLPTDAAVAPHALLERTHAELAAQARADATGDAATAQLVHGAAAVRHRRALFALLGKELPCECAICAEAMDAADAAADVALLPCCHVFHAPCIATWLQQGLQGTCPLCRAWSVAAGRDDVAAVREAAAQLGAAALQ